MILDKVIIKMCNKNVQSLTYLLYALSRSTTAARNELNMPENLPLAILQGSYQTYISGCMINPIEITSSLVFVSFKNICMQKNKIIHRDHWVGWFG